MPLWKFPLKFGGSFQTRQHNYSLMSYHAPVCMHVLTSSPKGGETGLLVLPRPQFSDTVAQSHRQSTFREVLELCPAMEPVVFSLFLGQASMSQLYIANDYRNLRKINPILLSSLHSVYLLAGDRLEIQLEERAN